MESNMKDKRGISLIIPMHNEEENIGGVLDSLLEFLPTLNLNYEIIVINDASTDNSPAIANSHPVRLINHSRNLGYGRAIKTGIKAAKYEFIIFFDADGQHPVNGIGKLVEKLFRCDAVIGERRKTNYQNLYRMLGLTLLRFLTFIILGIRTSDLNCGFRGFRKEVIKKYVHLLPDGFSASMTSTLIMLFRKYQVEYIPVVVAQRTGKSKLREISDGFRTLNQILRMAMMFVPWRIFGTLGVIFVVGGFIYGFITYFKTGGFPPSAVMAISTGVTSIFFGLLMDQIAEIRKERFEEIIHE